MYELEVYRSFSAAHRLCGYPGDCAKLHGHNWLVTVVLATAELDGIGIGFDFKVLKKLLDDVLGEFDHCCLNDLPDFSNMNPTSENLAKLIYSKVAAAIGEGPAKVARVKVSESPSSTAIYYE
ncbi:MAG: 6-pyruvoyl tetrahydropterin synthase family protein [Victivallaceae bacterium]|nr:6-carboxytetrahydropterin synthase [Victivallaceae bacterium]